MTQQHRLCSVESSTETITDSDWVRIYQNLSTSRLLSTIKFRRSQFKLHDLCRKVSKGAYLLASRWLFEEEIREKFKPG